MTSGQAADISVMLFAASSPKDELVTLLLGTVPTLPTEVTMSTSITGDVRVLLADVDRGLLVAYGPQSLMEDGLELTLPVRDSSGGGRDFTLRVERSFYQADEQTMLNLRVTEAVIRAGHREIPRLQFDEAAEAWVLESTLVDPQGLAVRTADLSETGFAFLTEIVCGVGDLIMFTVTIGERPITMQGRVRRVDAAPLRNRVACEITDIRDWDRVAIARVTRPDDDPQSSFDDDRHPEMAAARAQFRREQHQLQVRMAMRRYEQR
jgi:hypothetical protein